MDRSILLLAGCFALAVLGALLTLRFTFGLLVADGDPGSRAEPRLLADAARSGGCSPPLSRMSFTTNWVKA